MCGAAGDHDQVTLGPLGQLGSGSFGHTLGGVEPGQREPTASPLPHPGLNGQGWRWSQDSGEESIAFVYTAVILP